MNKYGVDLAQYISLFMYTTWSIVTRIARGDILAGNYRAFWRQTPCPVLQIEVCTEFACVRSDAVTATTAESIPTGVSPPSLTVQGANTVQATWSAPLQPNGIVLRYELVRKAKIPCTDL